MAKTKRPTGLTITRSGSDYIFKWKIADEDYTSGQTLQYRTRNFSKKWRNWHTVAIYSTTTSKLITLTRTDFHPYRDSYLTGIEFRVKGKRKSYTKDGYTYTPEWSDWSTKTLILNKPKNPSVSSELQDQWNVTKFTWDIPSKNDDAYVFSKYQWQSVLIKDCNVYEGSKVNWSSSNAGWLNGEGTSTSYSRTITEDTAVISNKSYTRWFRIRGRGISGDSDWRYTKHVYAKPYIAEISKATASKRATYYAVEMTWRAPTNAYHPIDQTITQYAFGVPSGNMQPPINLSWENGQVSKDTTLLDRSAFQTDRLTDFDECLFARVITQHDEMQGISAVKVVAKGKLNIPSNLSVSLNGTSATVSATNNSSACANSTSGNKNFLQIYYKGKKKNTSGISIGVIPYGQNSATVTIPSQSGETAYSIGVRAVVGTYTSSVGKDGTRRYTVKAEMSSDTIWSTADVPSAPANLQAEYNGDILVTWNWSWDDADGIEISWSKDADAWDSTKQPNTYTIEEHKEKLYIKEVDAGTAYYIRARFKAGEGFSPYSELISVDTTLPPEKPVLSLSNGIIPNNGKTTASWSYVSLDGTEQSYAEILCNDEVVGHTTTERHITLYSEDLGWTGGTSYELKLRVKSSSGSFSEYSDVVNVLVAEPLVCSISSSLTNVTVTDDTGSSRSVLSLTEMPFTVTVTGAGDGGVTEVVIERAEQYSINRPDDDYFNGYEGETIFLKRQIGEETITIDVSNCIGRLDDGAKYRIVANISNDIGQDTATLDFEVHWEHQAIEPQASVIVDGVIAKIQPMAPSGTATGDYCDIYRLSKDKPELIYPNAEFGTSYVDPYPAIGGGYRVVFLTKNGDYITSEEKPSWVDIDSGFEYDKALIDFGSDTVELYYNVDANHSWSKDFKETQYLGGSVQGDWNPAVSRSLDISAVTLNPSDEDTIRSLRKLAVYHGICNVRTLDGSSFHANIDVTESNVHDRYGLVSEFSLNVTRVDAQGYDGVELSAWEG